MNKIKYIIIFFAMFFCINIVNAFDNTLKIYDYGQILTDKEEIKLKEDIDKYISKNNIDIVVVSVRHYLQNTVDEYMNLFYTKNNFNKDGILIVFDLKNNNNNIAIQVFGRANELYSTKEINKMIVDIKLEKSYYNKINEFIDQSNYYIDKYNTPFKKNVLLQINYPIIIIISFIISSTIIIIMLSKNKIKKVAKNPIQNNMIINKKEEKYITTNTKKER